MGKDRIPVPMALALRFTTPAKGVDFLVVSEDPACNRDESRGTEYVDSNDAWENDITHE
jgi:hypothetical protein